MRIPITLAGAVIALPYIASAAGISATVDRTTLSLDEQATLTITIEGSQGAQPRLPSMEAFDVYSRGQSTQVQIINGRMSQSVVYHYVLAPQRAGRFTIGAARAEIDGQQYQSRPITLQVTSAPRAPAQAEDEDRVAFVTGSVSKPNPYVSEQIVYTFRFYRQVRVSAARLELPDFEGFAIEDLGKQRDFETVLNGQRYAVTELKKALFPQEKGTLTIQSAKLSCEVPVRGRGGRSRFDDPFFDDFFGRSEMQSRLLRSAPLTVMVAELPSPPPGFSGLVGQFALSAELTKNQLQTGQSTTLTITVTGTGNVQRIPEPMVEGLESFKVYDDKPSASIETKGNRVTGRRVFSKALVPTEAGAQSISRIALVYFDPKQKAYHTAQVGPLELNVSQGNTGEALHLTEALSPGGGKLAVQVLGDDILPIYTGIEALTTGRGGSPIVWSVLMAFPPFTYVALFALHRRRERFHADAPARRRRAAKSRYAKQLGRLREAIRASRRLEAAELASRGLREYLGDKLGIEGLALTPAEAGARLSEGNLPPGLVDEVEALLGWLEAARYGAATDDTRLKALPAQLGRLVKQLDRELPA